MSIWQLNSRSGLTALSSLKLSSRALLLVFLSLLFLVTLQLCYSMAHSANNAHQKPEYSVSQPILGKNPQHHNSQNRLIKQRTLAPMACAFMLCDAAHNISADLLSHLSSNEFGLPPLVGKLKAADISNLLRPPIFLHN